VTVSSGRAQSTSALRSCTSLAGQRIKSEACEYVMAKQTHLEPLTVSCGPTLGRFIALLIASSCIWFTVVLCYWLDPSEQQPSTQRPILGFSASWLLMTSLVLVAAYSSHWGKWRIDTNGIEFRHFFGKRPRQLVWSSVRRVHWSRERLAFKRIAPGFWLPGTHSRNR
jgi:hypothetical protein